MSNKCYLANAIRAHGWESFETSVICEVPNEELDEREILEIRERNTIAPNGYNLDGGGGSNKVVHQISREKMRKSQLGRKHPDEIKNKIAVAQTGERNHMYGKVFTEEHREKLRGSTSSTYDRSTIAEEDKPNKREICQYTHEGVFIKTYESILKAADSMGVDRTAISNCCRGKSKKSCGFIWKYKDPETYVINQYTLEGRFIKSFENIKTACEATGSSQSSIGKCCNGNIHTSNGFVWKRELKTSSV
jgi:group I intron endonuclease